MVKQNPIVGLAYVVTSQQEMLDRANEQIDKLKQELANLDNSVKQQAVSVIEASLADDRMSLECTGWQSYEPEMTYTLDEYGLLPMIHGLYYHHENSELQIYDAKEGNYIPLKFKFDISKVHTTIEHGGFKILPCERGDKGSTTLIAVRITYFNRFVGKTWDEIKPRLCDSSIEDRYLEALAAPNHAGAE